MAAERDPRQSGAVLALPAGGDDQHFAARQAHRRVEIDRVREIGEIAGGARDRKDAVERTAGNAKLAIGGAGDRPKVCSRAALEAKVVTSTLPFAAATTSSSPPRTVASEPEGSALKTLVESHTIASTPSSPIAFSASSLVGAPICGAASHLPVAGVEHLAVGRVDQQRIGLGDRMGERHVADAERAELERSAELDDVELDLAGDPFLLQLVGDQAGGEGRGVERHAEIGGHIGNRADMILMAVGEDDAEQVLAALLDELEVGQDQFDARIARIGEGHAKIDHQPFAVAAIEIDVHADLAGAAEGEEEKFFRRGRQNSFQFNRHPSAG